MKVHSNDNISEEMRRYRKQRVRENPTILEKRGHTGSVKETLYIV